MRILFPVDGSVCARKTLEWAVGFLNSHTHTVLIVIVVFPAINRTQRETEEEAAQTVMAAAKALFESNGFTVEKAECLHEYVVANPAAAICKYAAKENVDQIIIGSHGHQRLAKFLMGSVAADVFRKARRPVLVINNQLQDLGEVSTPDFLGQAK